MIETGMGKCSPQNPGGRRGKCAGAAPDLPTECTVVGFLCRMRLLGGPDGGTALQPLLSPRLRCRVRASLYGWRQVSAGAVTGILAGQFGIGGGAITVPMLFEVARLLDVPEAVRMQLCIGTSMAVIRRCDSGDRSVRG